MKKIIILLIVISCVIGFNSQLAAQGFGASGLSMGGAYIALARGVDAFAWNPANLSLSHDSRFEINLVGAKINSTNSSMTVDEYNRYFTESGHHGEWDVNDIDHILDLIPDDGLEVSGETKGNALGLMFGRYGISAQAIGRAHGLIPKSVFELGLRGNQELYKEFDFADLDGEGFSALKLSLSLSHPFKIEKFFEEFAVGVNINYYKGINHAGVTKSDGAFLTTNSAILASIDVTSRSGQNGDGFGFDLGATGRINDQWTVSMAFYNMFTGIKWKQELEEQQSYFIADSLKLGELDEGNTLDTTITRSIDPYTTTLPLVFRVGVGYQLYDNLVFALDLEQAFEEKMGYTDRAQLALGVQYSPIAFLPLRAGMSFGGLWKYRMALGLGLHLGFFHVDFAYVTHQAVWYTQATGVSMAVNLKLVF